MLPDIQIEANGATAKLLGGEGEMPTPSAADMPDQVDPEHPVQLLGLTSAAAQVHPEQHQFHPDV
jgi:hypothetical protein